MKGSAWSECLLSFCAMASPLSIATWRGIVQCFENEEIYLVGLREEDSDLSFLFYVLLCPYVTNSSDIALSFVLHWRWLRKAPINFKKQSFFSLNGGVVTIKGSLTYRIAVGALEKWSHSTPHCWACVSRDCFEIYCEPNRTILAHWNHEDWVKHRKVLVFGISTYDIAHVHACYEQEWSTRNSP